MFKYGLRIVKIGKVGVNADFRGKCEYHFLNNNNGTSKNGKMLLNFQVFH